MNNPLFSIITVCYNSETSIEKTMKSILSQDCINYDYIIVDGNSKDGTVELIKKYESLFSGRMRWISEPDKGIYDAFSKGVQMATGKYVWIVNSDDYIQPNILSTLEKVIYQDGTYLPIISGAMNFVDDRGEILNVCKSEEDKLEYSYSIDDIGVTHPATLVPLDIYKRIGSYDIKYKLAGDVDWFHRAYQAGCNFLFIDNVLTNMSDGGISSQFTLKRYKISLKDRLYFCRKFYKNPFVRVYHLLMWNFHILLVFIKKYLKNKFV